MAEPLPRAFGRGLPSHDLSIAQERLLVERAAKGDQQAVGRLYDFYVAPLYRFCLARVGNETDAEDLTEEIFLKVMRGIGGFQWRPLPPSATLTPSMDGKDRRGRPKPPAEGVGDHVGDSGSGALASQPAGAQGNEVEDRSPFRAWLFRIARNHIVSHYRSSAARGTVGEVPEWIEDHRRGPAELAELALTVEEVFAAVQLLPQAQREVILLRFGSGLSVAETADALEKQQTNVKVLQHKGVKKLKELLVEAHLLRTADQPQPDAVAAPTEGHDQR